MKFLIRGSLITSKSSEVNKKGGSWTFCKRSQSVKLLMSSSGISLFSVPLPVSPPVFELVVCFYNRVLAGFDSEFPVPFAPPAFSRRKKLPNKDTFLLGQVYDYLGESVTPLNYYPLSSWSFHLGLFRSVGSNKLFQSSSLTSSSMLERFVDFLGDGIFDNTLVVLLYL